MCLNFKDYGDDDKFNHLLNCGGPIVKAIARYRFLYLASFTHFSLNVSTFTHLLHSLSLSPSLSLIIINVVYVFVEI